MEIGGWIVPMMNIEGFFRIKTKINFPLIGIVIRNVFLNRREIMEMKISQLSFLLNHNFMVCLS